LQNLLTVSCNVCFIDTDVAQSLLHPWNNYFLYCTTNFSTRIIFSTFYCFFTYKYSVHACTDVDTINISKPIMDLTLKVGMNILERNVYSIVIFNPLWIQLETGLYISCVTDTPTRHVEANGSERWRDSNWTTSTATKFKLGSLKDAMFNRDGVHLDFYNTFNPNKIRREKVHSELYNRKKKVNFFRAHRVVQYNLTNLQRRYWNQQLQTSLLNKNVTFSCCIVWWMSHFCIVNWSIQKFTSL
jgi:hypothetical protein